MFRKYDRLKNRNLEDSDKTVKAVTPDDQASSTISTQSKDDDANFHFDESSFKPADEFGLDLYFFGKVGAGADHESNLARRSLFRQFNEDFFKPTAEFGLELDFLEKIGTGADHESNLARRSFLGSLIKTFSNQLQTLVSC